MGDMKEAFDLMRRNRQESRRNMLAQADTTGWTQHTEWHYSRLSVHGRVDWWPSAGKTRHKGEMIRGHKNVSRLLARLFDQPKEARPHA